MNFKVEIHDTGAHNAPNRILRQAAMSSLRTPLPLSPATPAAAGARPRIWAMGISRLSRAFADLIPAYAARAEFRIVGRAFEAAASAINREARESRVDVVVAGGS